MTPATDVPVAPTALPPQRGRGGDGTGRSLRVYVEVARRAFQRQGAYRTANLAGIFTNCTFGYLRAVPLMAALAVRPQIEGYDAATAMTWNWLVQALIAVVALWGWWEVAATIRTGDVALDLARPIDYLGYWFARDAGRAAWFLAFRAVPIFLVGAVTAGVRWPQAPLTTWPLFVASLGLAVATSFAWRFLLNLMAFVLVDYRGVASLGLVTTTFLSGFLVPLAFFPPWARVVLEYLPFAAIVEAPATVFLELAGGLELVRILAVQAAWAVAMLGLARGGAAWATRRVVVQGG
jgi:ABC-2 type transport system permease protein